MSLGLYGYNSNVQHHKSLTPTYVKISTFGHSGAHSGILALRTERQSARMSEI